MCIKEEAEFESKIKDFQGRIIAALDALWDLAFGEEQKVMPHTCHAGDTEMPRV